jgi:acetyl-CoA synthetase
MAKRINTLGGYIHEYQKSVQDPQGFWGEVAQDFFWRKRWDQVCHWDSGTSECEWFQGAKLNITENIFDRRLYTHKDRVAIIWEPNDPDEQSQIITYGQLFDLVCRCVAQMRSLGLERGDRVILYMPMVPEALVAMLACARIGAVHSVVFAGFSAQALAERINDCQAKMVVTACSGNRGSKVVDTKGVVDEALRSCSCVEKVLLVGSPSPEQSFVADRDVRWESEHFEPDTAAEEMDSEDMLFILYTSGSTGKPKGVVHTCGGYMVYTAYTFENVFQYEEGDVYWCTADIGWITGHSYIVYGPLLCGATIVMFEGVPTYPDCGRFWSVVEKHKVNQFYTAPTAIRALQAAGDEFIAPYDLASLKVLGTVGEPINEDAWHWYHSHIGRGRCPIVDTWWQTETGGIMISPIAGITPTKPGFATLPLPGIQPSILDDQGRELYGRSVEGNLAIRFPWPSMIRTTYGDADRYRSTYFSKFPGFYFTGDGVRRDEDGYYRILGRVDDVINVSGHRLGTAEIENAINEHPRVLETAVIGMPHKVKGEAIAAFIVADLNDRTQDNLIREVRLTVERIIGPIARPEAVFLVSALPKTRSGKIMRRLLRLVSSGERQEFGDISTLLNPEIVDELMLVVEAE